MPTIQKILCPVDFSPATDQVVDYALEFSRVFAASLVLLYVAPSLKRYTSYQIRSGFIDSFVGQIKTGAEERMKSFLSEHVPAGADVQWMIGVGDASEVIMHKAEEAGADLIVMGTHGRRGIESFLFGSVAERVVKGSSIPVVTVRPTKTP